MTYADVEHEFYHGQWGSRAGRTKIKHRGQLLRFFRWCQKHGYTKHNPLEQLDIPKKWRRQERRAKETTGRALSVEEARRLLKAAGDPNRRLVILTALLSGLRQSNIIGGV